VPKKNNILTNKEDSKPSKSEREKKKKIVGKIVKQKFITAK
jgi:hypothetical protein